MTRKVVISVPVDERNTQVDCLGIAVQPTEADMIQIAPSFVRSTLLIYAFLTLLGPADAATTFRDWKPGNPCLARSCDAKHLSAHPEQRLTNFALSASGMSPALPKGEFEVTFRFKVRGQASVYQAEGICRGGSDKADCRVEGDGGQFTMKATGEGLLLTISRIAVEGDADFSPEIGVGGDDRLVRLKLAPKSACRFN